ncbi:DNA-binding transcriptional regulator Fis [Balneatrix alpica]|uniref:Putative Fis-like DNA-binding protein n=1 Tax=Balneatrix alpica TaxID=75684 RepID=A0ABV5ZD19_9GAMM
MALTKLNTQETPSEVKKTLTPVVPAETSQTLRDTVARSLENYFKQLDGQQVQDVYQMVLAEIEQPLFETVMHYTKDNQTKASKVLGLNRGTLRKKLKQYDLL